MCSCFPQMHFCFFSETLLGGRIASFSENGWFEFLNFLKSLTPMAGVSFKVLLCACAIMEFLNGFAYIDL